MAARPRATSEINITPMIDVLLVLLVIFMVTLPLHQRGLDISLPPQTAPRAVPPPTGIVLSYTADGRLSVNNRTVELRELEERLRAIYESRRDKTLIVMAAGTLRYGEVVHVIDAARGAGVARVGLVTESMRQRAGVE